MFCKLEDRYILCGDCHCVTFVVTPDLQMSHPKVLSDAMSRATKTHYRLKHPTLSDV
jgi:hypothetical protein